MGTLLERAERIVTILSGLAGLVGLIVSIVNAVPPSRFELQLDKQSYRVHPRLLARLQAENFPGLADYQDPHFGAVTLDITNCTHSEARATVELGGLEKFTGAEVVDSQLAGKELYDYQARLGGLALQPGKPCPTKHWSGPADLKLDLPVPPLQGFGGHMTLAVYGSPFERVDVCLNGAPVDIRYHITTQDSFMLHQYWYWFAGFSVLLLAAPILVIIRSIRGSVGKTPSGGASAGPSASGVGKT